MERRPLFFGNQTEQMKSSVNGHHYPSMAVPQQGARARFEEFTPFASGFC
jgi:hypothetical protein